jgi:hypothetical protein
VRITGGGRSICFLPRLAVGTNGNPAFIAGNGRR